MKSLLQGFLLTLILLFSLTSKITASHAVGIDIHYECLGGNQYQFFVEFYRDCDGIAAPTSVNISMSSASCGINTSTTLTQVSSQEVSQICGTQIPNTTCNGGNLPGIQQYTYSGTFTLPSQCSDWVVSYSTCCRNSGITNLLNAGSQNLYVEATIDNTGGLCNSSPIFNSLPTPYLCVNQPFSFNNGAVDPDGNTLVYTLINPLSASGANIPYNGGFTAANPMAVTGAFNFDPATGQMSFTPNQIQQGVITVLVEEYDTFGNLVGTTMRDIQVVVINCTNTPPTGTGVNGSATVFDYDICAGNSFCFDIISDDLDANATTMTWNQGIPGATFTTAGAPFQTGTFCWTPTDNDVGSHFFTVTVEDDACPIPGINTYIYQVDIVASPDPPVDAGPDQDICQGETTTISATAGPGADITWSPSTGLSCTNCPNPTVTVNSNQIYTATAVYPSGCSQMDQVAINIAPTPFVSVFPTNLSICSGSNAAITANSPTATSYSWAPGGMTTPSINVSPASSTVYTVTASNNFGCTAEATSTVTVSPPPPTEVCNNIYVTPFGGGTGDSPLDPTDLASALLMSQCNNATIKLAIGTYNIDNPIVDILGYTTLEGGYDPGNNWTKTSLPGATTIFRSNLNPEGPANAQRLVAIYMNSASYFRFQDLTIEVADAPATGTSAMSTYGVHMTSCSNYDFVRCQIIAGNAMDGADGTDGADGADGANGLNGQAGDGDDENSNGGGGAGGVGAGATGGTAGNGGACCTTGANNGAAGGAAGNAQDGGGGAGGASGGGEDRDGGVGGNGGGTLGAGGTAGQESGCNGGTISCGASESGNAGQAGGAGTNGTDGAIAAAGSNGTGFWAPGGNGANGTAGSGGAGGGGGGGGAGEGGFFCIDGKGSGGGGGGGGGQGGFPGTGGSSGGSSYAIYAYLNGANGNFSQSDLSAGIAGSGGLGGNGGIGGNGGNGGAGSTYNSEVGCGGNGGNGGDGGNGGNGGNGSPGESMQLYLNGTAIVSSDINFNLNAQPQIFMENISCTNNDIDFSSAASATWGLGATATPASPTGANVTTQYTGLGRKDINFGPDLYAGFANITLDGVTDPDINTTALQIAVDTFVVCIGSSADFFTTASNFVEFNWDFGGAITPNNYDAMNLPNLTFNTPGTYTITLEGRTDCCGWSTPVDIVLIVDDLPTVTVAGVMAYCEGGNTTITATTNVDSLVWSPNYGINVDTGTVVLFNPPVTTDYIVTAFSEYGVCSATENFTITVNELPDITTSSTGVTCGNDGTATATAANITNPLNYQWNDPNNQTVNPAVNLFAGNYQVIVTDAVTGCLDTAYTNVSAGTSPFVYVSNQQSISCFGGSDGFITADVSNGTAPFDFVWIDDATNATVFTENNVTTSTVNNLSIGNYTVQITDANGCEHSTSVGLGEPDLLYVMDTTIINATCYATNDGSIAITTDGGVAPFTFLWDAAAGSATIDSVGGLNPGNYTVEVTDGNGCILNETYTVDGPLNPLITDAGLADTLCGSDYLLQAVPTAGNVTGNWLDALSVGPGTATFDNLTDPNSNVNIGSDYGAYTFYWTEDNGAGCPDTAEVEIVFFQPPSVDANVDDTVCNSYDYTFDAISTLPNNEWAFISGPGNAVFSDINSLSSDVTVDAVGVYSFEIISLNAFNCEARDTVNISFSDPSFTNTVVDDECSAAIGSITVDAVANSFGTILYSNDNGANYQASNIFNNLSGNDYDVIVIDDLLCTDTTIVTVNNTGTLTVNDTTLVNPLCYSFTDGEISIDATTTTPPLSYQIDGAAPQASNIFANLGDGSYEIVVIDGNLCTDTLIIDLVQPDSIMFDTVTVSPLCFGDCDGEINLSNITGGNNTYSYSIDNGATFQGSPNFINVCQGNYDVITEDGNGCQSNMVVTVFEPTALTLNVNIDSTTCNNVDDGIVTATVAGGTPTYSYNWNGLALNNQFQATDVPAGVYDLVITDDNGCTIDTIGYEVGEPTPVNTGVISTTSTLCFGDQNGSIQVTGAVGVGNLSYSIDGINFQAGNTFTSLNSGTYTVHIQDANGCVNTISTIVDSPNPVTAEAQSTAISLCIGEPFTLLGVGGGGTGVLSYSWNAGLGAGQNQTVTASVSGAYEVTVVDENGCTATDLIQIEVLPSIDVTAFSDVTICPGQTASISAFATGGDGNGNPLNYTFNWNNGVVGMNQDVTPAVTTTYSVYATDGCTSISDTAYVTITVATPPVVDFSLANNNGCTPITVSFIDNSPVSGVSCVWNFGDGFVSTDCGNATHTYTTPGVYDVSYTITDVNGCATTLLFNDSVAAYDIPIADFSFTPETGSLINSEITYSNESFGSDNYIWLFGDAVIPTMSNEENPIIQYPNSNGGVYNTCLIATNDEGCSDTICKELEISDEFLLYVPNTFTPDGDGINDFFGPSLLGVSPEGYEFLIFNRWGQLIFESNSLNDTWDGTYQGADAPIDTYVWKIKIDQTAESNFEKLTGHVNLIR